MKKLLPILITALTYLCISIIPAHTFAASSQSGAKSTVKANIPFTTTIRLFGYAPANSMVQVLGVRVFAQTTADKNGYWVFYELPISAQARELCISAIDAEKRVSFPSCIYLPETDKPSEIGPVLLAPTVSLSSGSLWQNETGNASGFAIPNSTVKVSFFEVQDNIQTGWRLAKWAEAAEIPILTTQAGNLGEFSFSLPTWKTGNWRMFVKAIYNNQPTPKSQTLLFTIGAIINYWFIYILPKLLWLLAFLIALILFILWEKRHKRVRKLVAKLIEKKWKPFAVRSGLMWRRLQYNLRHLKK